MVVSQKNLTFVLGVALNHPKRRDTVHRVVRLEEIEGSVCRLTPKLDLPRPFEGH